MNLNEEDIIKRRDNSIGFLMHRAATEVSKRMNRNFTELGIDITKEQFFIIMALSMHKEGLTQQEIAEFSYKNKVCISKIIDSLEKRELVVRKPSEKDRRVKKIYLTEQAHELQSGGFKVVQKTISEAEAGISKEDIETCKNVLRKISQNLQ